MYFPNTSHQLKSLFPLLCVFVCSRVALELTVALLLPHRANAGLPESPASRSFLYCSVMCSLIKVSADEIDLAGDEK